MIYSCRIIIIKVWNLYLYTGTYLLQNITAMPTFQANEILVSCDFIHSYRTPFGFLAIVYTELDPHPHYGIATRSQGDFHAEVTISGLIMNEYRVSVFILKDDGLPMSRSAFVSQIVSNITGKKIY